jgi:hypothetical protein
MTNFKHRLVKHKLPIAVMGVGISILAGAVIHASQNKVGSSWVYPRVSYIRVEVPVEVIKQPETIDEMIEFVFGDQADEAKRIAMCESTMNPNATHVNTGGSIDAGLMQINSVHGVPVRYLKNPMINLLIAKQIYDAQGWNPWTCQRKAGL